jgi:REP element-mobilizing transposase RayT
MPPRPRIIAHHLILSAYGSWLPNDPRGSGSEEIRKPTIEALGPIHHGRRRVQPPRHELKSFYKSANPKLEHQPLWFSPTHREQIADAFRLTIKKFRYTVWACFIGSNHAHLCVRAHRDSHETMWTHLADQSTTTLTALNPELDDHPLWADRPYGVFLRTTADIRRTIRYIQSNAMKENLPVQQWDYVATYGGWPNPN